MSAPRRSTLGGFVGYAEVCGRTMARAHSRSGDAAAIVGYAGTGTRFAQAITAFAVAYAGQVRRDYDELVAAVRSAGSPACQAGDRGWFIPRRCARC